MRKPEKKQVIIIINDKSKIDAEQITEILSSKYKVSLVSTDTPSEIVASSAGCMSDEMDKKSVEFRKKLKELIDWYNGASLTYCYDSYEGFMLTDENVFIVRTSSDKEFNEICGYFRHRLPHLFMTNVLMYDITNAEIFDGDTFVKSVFEHTDKVLLG